MSVAIRRGGIAINEALAVNDARRLHVAIGIQVIHAAHAAINHRNPDACAIPSIRIGDIRVDRGNHVIQSALHSAIRRDIRNVGVRRQAREIRSLHAYQLRLH